MLILYSSSFLIAVSSALLAYIISSFLGTIIDPKFVGLIFTIAYFLSLISVHYFSYFINYFGKFYSIIILLGLTFLSLSGIAFLKSSLLSLILVIIYDICAMLVWVNLDVFIEFFSRDAQTGRIRGINLTVMNLGWVVSPIMTGFLISKGDFPLVFLISALVLAPVILLVIYNFERNHTNFSQPGRVKTVIKEVLKRRQLRSIFYLAFILSFFYAWMVIYTPLYLRDLGFSWEEIGLAFTIMLVPFVIFQYPAGYIADKYLGETEMLTASIVIMSLSTIALFFFTAPAAIIILLFTTRVGASVLEILRDSYFYKHISVKDINLIDYFRNTGPLAYIISPLLATVILYFLPMNYLYLILGLFCLSGLWCTLRMPDTK